MNILEELKKKGASQEEVNIVGNEIIGQLKAKGATKEEMAVVAKEIGLGDPTLGLERPKGNIFQQMQGAFNEEGQKRKELLSSPNARSKEDVQPNNPLFNVSNAGQRELKEMGKGLLGVPGAVLNYYNMDPMQKILFKMKLAEEVPKQYGISMGTSITHPGVSFGKPIEHTTNLLTLLKFASMGVNAAKNTSLGKGITEKTGKAVSEAASLTTGVEPELTNRWVSRTDKVFTKENLGKEAWKTAGQKVTESVKDVGKEYAKAVRVEADALKNIEDPIIALGKDELDDIGNIMNRRIYQDLGKVRGIDPEDMTKIGEYQSMLTRPQTPSNLHKIKLELDEILKAGSFYDNQAKTVKPVSDVMQSSLFSMRTAINDKLRLVSDGYKVANETTSKLLNAEKALKGPLNSVNPGAQIKGILSNPNNLEKADALKEISDALPEKKQFWDLLKDVQAAQESNRIFRKGGGILATLGATGGAAYKTGMNPFLTGAAFTATSPKALSYGLRGASLSSDLVNSITTKLPLKELLASSLAANQLKR